MSILDREYSSEFDKLRKNRVEVSFYKYGSARDNFGSGRVDAIGSLELCLDKFKKTGNTEYLLDVANYAMFRYMSSSWRVLQGYRQQRERRNGRYTDKHGVMHEQEK